MSLELAYKVIDEVLDLTLEEIEKEVMNDFDKWNYYKRLVQWITDLCRVCLILL